MKKTSLFLACFAFVAVAGFLAVRAQTTGPYDMKGWAWSSNTGWLSFNSANATSGGGSYKVTVDNVSGALNGYVWSSNIGWIKFGGLSAFPSGPNTLAANAIVSLTTGALSGWARACAGTVNAVDPLLPGDCSSMTSRTDGWDGWISLAGLNYESPNTSLPDGTSNRGVSMKVANDSTKGLFSGYAWNSDVMGWIGFKPAIAPGDNSVNPVCEDCGGGGTPGLTGTCVNGGSGNVISLPSTGGTVNFTVSGLNGTGPYTYAWATGGSNSGSGSAITTTYSSNAGASAVIYSPAVVVTDTGNSNAHGTVNCGTVTVQSATAVPNSIKVNIGKTAALARSGNTREITLHQNRPFSLTWDYDPAVYTACDSYAAPAWAVWDSADATASGSGAVSSNTATNDFGTYVFTLSCSNIDPAQPGATAHATLNIVTTSVREQ